MWVEVLCPYLSLSDSQAFRLCSRICNSLIRQSIPFSVEFLQAKKTALASSINQQEEEEYKASEMQRMVNMAQVAQAALSSLNKGDVETLRKMKHPSAPVLATVKATNLLLGLPTSENPFQHWGPNMISNLQMFNRSSVTAKMLKAMEKFRSEWSEEAVAKASKNCVGLYRYLGAILLLSTPAPPRPPGEIQKMERTIEIYKRLATK